MRIGFDARPLSHPYTGIGRYTACLVPLLEELGLDLVPISAKGSKLLEIAQANFTFRSRIHKAKVDLFWSPRHHLPLLMPRVPTVVTIHDLVWRHASTTMPTMRRTYDGLMMRHACARANAVITPSHSTLDDLVDEFGTPEQKIHVTPLASTLEEVERSYHDQSYILFVGTDEPRKNLARLVTAFKAAEIPENTHLKVVANSGWKSGDIDFDHPRIERLQGVTDRELAHLYKGALFVAAPSLYEGFGLQLVEAFKCGKAVLTSSGSATEEVAGDAAHLVDPYDANAIRQGIEQLSNNLDLRTGLEAAAFARAQAFSWQQTASQTAQIFAQVTDANPARRC